MPYNVGSRGTYGCSGYPVVKDDGTVMGCHETRAEAEAQQRAIYANENKVNKSMYSVVADNPACNGQFAVVDESGEVEGCFETRPEAESFASMKNKDEQDDEMDDIDMYMSKWNGVFSPVIRKAEKPNYGDIIKPRKGEPADKELYNRVKAEAKRKFEVYPSAVANAWVVAEYKRRGGTYK